MSTEFKKEATLCYDLETVLATKEKHTFEYKLDIVLDEIESMLLSKNRSYGNSALNPSRVFSSASSIEGLKVRIDDKINRIKNNPSGDTEDSELDLLGYLIMLRIAKKYGV